MRIRTAPAVITGLFCFSLVSCLSGGSPKDDCETLSSADESISNASLSTQAFLEERVDDPDLPRDDESILYGLIEERKEAKGTLSEYSYFVILSDGGKTMILFNDIDLSRGFDPWIGKRVEIRCMPAKGKLGFRKAPVDGVKVISIRQAG